jgi:hypothetical protein
MRQQFGNGETYSYSYDWKPDHLYSDTVVVTVPNQTKRDVNVAAAVLDGSIASLGSQYVGVRNQHPRSSNQ